MSTGRAIWRKPDEDKVFSISDTGGNDEFIIAPFLINEDPFSIKGNIKVCSPDSIIDFLKGIEPVERIESQSTPKEHYLKIVGKAIEAINDGQFEKVVLARRYFIKEKIDPATLFLKLAAQYPRAFVYCFAIRENICMIGATPETLLIKKGAILITEALGGTEQANGYGDKEYDEHRQVIMDIGNKLSTRGYAFSLSGTTSKVAGNVSHLSTIFSVESKPDLNDLELVKTLHPTSAVCGLPFQPAYNFLLRHEGFDRHYYSGYLGVKIGNDFNFYVNLRCAEIFAGGVLLYAGAGINKDSQPENEWTETVNKLDTLLKMID